MEPSVEPPQPNWGWWTILVTGWRLAATTFSAALLVFVAVCYWRRPDVCTVVTLFPPWCWVLIGGAVAGLAFSRVRWWPSVILAVGWLTFLVGFADEPSSFVRMWLPQPARSESLRVVTLNCAGVGSAARAVRAFDPDIVLVQESPSSGDLEALATDMFGSTTNLVRGVDASILARGRVQEVQVPRQSRGNFVHARVELRGQAVNVISLRLWPCPVQFNLWSPDCWRYYQWNREGRRRQLAQVADYIATLPDDVPLIVGGDFNCPPRDAVFRLLEPRLTDAYSVAGRGWGATIIALAGWQLIRIDQIWVSGQLQPLGVVARFAEGSDHSMVVADFAVESP
jgi:endonuclease/exonuclease/phosphatase family metal-dependent hydrolase